MFDHVGVETAKRFSHTVGGRKDWRACAESQDECRTAQKIACASQHCGDEVRKVDARSRMRDVVFIAADLCAVDGVAFERKAL